MATVSEKTFGKRHTQGVALYDRIKDEDGYTPEENPLITKAALKTHLGEIGTINEEIPVLAGTYNQAQDDRIPMYHGAEGWKKRVGMMRDVVGGFQNGKKLAAYQTLVSIAQDMRGYRKPKNDPAPIGTEPADAEDSPSQAQLSFGSLLQKAREAVGAVVAMGDKYKTSNPLVTVAALKTYLKTTEQQDTTITDALKPLRQKVKARMALYEGEEGLQARMAAVKSYVAGNHTKESPLYKDLVKIKY